MKILVIDVGGTRVKLGATYQHEIRKFDSGPNFTPGQLARGIREHAADWQYDVISLGYPGLVREGQPALEPLNLAKGWVAFDFATHLGKPVKVINDAAMQALGSYDGGRMLYLGLGTGLGSTLIVPKQVVPLNLGALPYKRGILDDKLSRRGLKKLGLKRWTRAVNDAIHVLKDVFAVDYVMVGGGNAKRLANLPPGTRLGDNSNAILGGYRMWYAAASMTPTQDPTVWEATPAAESWKIA